MSIFVVVWHMDGGGRSLIFSKDRYLEHIFTVSDFVNFHLLLLAVPTFIFISIYLYASKPISVSALKKRFVRIATLLFFWPIAAISYHKGYEGLLSIIPSSPVDFIYKVLSAGNTAYYFFSSLIICLFITHFFLLINRNLQLSVLFISTALLAFLPQLTKISGFYPLTAYWSPLNFIPASFAAAVFSQNEQIIFNNRSKFLFFSVLLCVLFSIIEWRYSVGEMFFLGQKCAIPIYTRTSLLFAVFSIFVLALDPSIKSNSLINFMSKYSLALYCLHPFLMKPATIFVSTFFQNEIVRLYAPIMLVVIFSYFLAIILRKYYLKEEVLM